MLQIKIGLKYDKNVDSLLIPSWTRAGPRRRWFSFRDAPVLFQKPRPPPPPPPRPPPPPPPWGPCRGPEHGSSDGSVSLAHLFTTCLILLQIQTRRRRRAAPIEPQECDGGLQRKKPQVNTASVARLFDNKIGWRAVSLFIVSLLFFPVPVSPPTHPPNCLLLLPYKYCLCRMVLSCTHYYNTALPAISVPQIFSIQAPHVYSKYWVTLFGNDSQTRALRKEKEIHSKWKVMIHTTDNV